MSGAGEVDSRKLSAKPLGVDWIHGSSSAKHNTDPDLQVHWYDEHTVLLRQNKAINYEAPFLYLLFGIRQVVLIDTGATAHRNSFRCAGLSMTLLGRGWRATPATPTGFSYSTRTRTAIM
ncbi:hypothetical protein ACWCRD_44710 [Streptomyces sp. NPDC002092]